MAIDYTDRIPNNVDLSDNRTLQRALERWQPHYIDWWRSLGPEGFLETDVYLRTAISVDAKGWATYGMVKMPDYRWGIFLADATEDRRIGFGDHMGEPAWQQIPGEHRATLRRLIVTQGDTEPASVEQQRRLGQNCPSLYDLRNLLQVNVEEGRHLWAMVYLLHAHFGRDGRDEAEELLERHSGDPDKPRILGTFNEPIEDWLSFFCFTFFTDRDGKFQLLSLAESGFDPLSRTCRFMLTEEAHHMFVGDTGIGRVIKRTLEAMAELGTDDPQHLRAHGVVDLALLQRYVNFWFSSSLDLFGNDISTNAASYFANSLKGRPGEERFEDHDCRDATYRVEVPAEGDEEVPMRNAMNAVTRAAYIQDCEIGVKRWNRLIRWAGREEEIRLPSPRFRRAIGPFGQGYYDPAGNAITEAEWRAGEDRFLPTAADRAHVASLMQRVTEPGKIAGWIAPPDRGINAMPVEYEYVRL